MAWAGDQQITGWGQEMLPVIKARHILKGWGLKPCAPLRVAGMLGQCIKRTHGLQMEIWCFDHIL